MSLFTNSEWGLGVKVYTNTSITPDYIDNLK